MIVVVSRELIVGSREVVDEVFTSSGEHKHFAAALTAMRPHDTDHFSLSAMLSYLFKQSQFAW